MHSLPSRRRLPQPNFFRFKCYRLSPLPIPRPPTSVPAPSLHLPGLLPTSQLPINTPRPVSASTHALAHTLAPAAACRQAQRPPAARCQTSPHAPGTVRQADAQLDCGTVVCQGRGTFSQSANGDSVIVPLASPDPLHLSLLKSHEDHLPRLPSFSHSSIPCGPFD